MLRLVSNDGILNRHACSRREFLRIGTLGLGGLSLSNLLEAQNHRAWHSLIKDKSVVMLNLQGGPSQFETFDPKMDLPSENRSAFGEVKTSLPGIRFGGHFPRLAKLANHLAVVRSYRHGISDHGSAAKHVAAGGNATGACIGTLFSTIAGPANPNNGMPMNSIVIPAAIDTRYKSFNAVPSRVTDTGSLSPTHKAFDPSSGGNLLEDMTLSIPSDRFQNRRALVARLDRLRRHAEASESLLGATTFQQQAADTILGGLNKAFDWTQEDPRLIERYDTSRFAVPQHVIDQRGARGDLVKNHTPISLGKQMLLARRLCEAGCRFVTVTSAGWDMHGDHEFSIYDGMPLVGPAVDRAVSTFIEDLAERGLTDQILLVITGEFGRTPKINAKGGRDHWGNLCPLVFAGGGLPMGQVIGASDRFGGSPNSDPVTSQQVLGTIMHALVHVGELRTRTGFPREVLDVVTGAKPIPQLT